MKSCFSALIDTTLSRLLMAAVVCQTAIFCYVSFYYGMAASLNVLLALCCLFAVLMPIDKLRQSNIFSKLFLNTVLVLMILPLMAGLSIFIHELVGSPVVGASHLHISQSPVLTQSNLTTAIGLYGIIGLLFYHCSGYLYSHNPRFLIPRSEFANWQKRSKEYVVPRSIKVSFITLMIFSMSGYFLNPLLKQAHSVSPWILQLLSKLFVASTLGMLLFIMLTLVLSLLKGVYMTITRPTFYAPSL